ncbi:MAG: hypothetical protein NXH97_21095 [Rhodobacteraceae bacterium]|nr:hypothetical protein [Paracoccaceae bacterium]
MTKHEDPKAPESGLSHSPEALLQRYGDHLDEAALTDAQKQEFLTVLWQIMVVFVDLGFSLKAGDNFTPNCDHGISDVLEYLHIEETAPETVAPKKSNKNKETT